jgi:hypothetical protein
MRFPTGAYNFSSSKIIVLYVQLMLTHEKFEFLGFEMVQNLLSVTVHLPGWIQQGFTKGGRGVLGEQPRKSIQMNWFLNDSSAEGVSSLVGSGVCAQKIWKIRTLKMPFPVIWAFGIMSFSLTSKKGKHWKLCHMHTPLYAHPPINAPLLYNSLGGGGRAFK